MWEKECSPGRAHQLAIHYRTVSLENVHTSNIIQTEHGILRNMYIYTNTYMDITTIKKRGHELERENIGCLGRSKGKGEMT